jgi:hypothetical protein
MPAPLTPKLIVCIRPIDLPGLPSTYRFIRLPADRMTHGVPKGPMNTEFLAVEPAISVALFTKPPA